MVEISSDTIIVVPCYNEASRLPTAVLLRFAAEHPNIRFVMVDDGSTDATGSILRDLQQTAPNTFRTLHNATNQGKAEAVRRGVMYAIGQAPAFVGYWDADLSTPLDSIVDFRRSLLADPLLTCVIGSRVKRLGATITRKPARHYLGRVFATLAARTLRVAVYDTQCGAKLFRVCPVVESAFAEPFTTRWIFDVEVLARIDRGSRRSGATLTNTALEYPLTQWHDVSGSRLGIASMARALVDLWRISRICQ